MTKRIERYTPVILDGQRVRLESLDEQHLDGLIATVKDGELWNIRETLVPHVEELPTFIAEAKANRVAGVELPFAVIDKMSGRVVGSTRFFCPELAHQRVEIGYSFLAQSCQGSGMNLEAKLLMLDYAFDALHCNRVEFLTDGNNLKSQRALEKLGAVQEGLMKYHMVLRNGYVRDSYMYALYRADWAEKRALLLENVVTALEKNTCN